MSDQTPNQKEEPRIVNIKCRQKDCPSMTATVQMEKDTRMYVCTECGIPQVMNPGGHFPY